MSKWSRWQSFPDPKAGGYLSAPFGPGVYELRNRESGERIYCGQGKNVAKRMTSLLPEPGGAGTRKNMSLRNYIFQNLDDIDYRTKACADEATARAEERKQKSKGGSYVFPT